MLLTDADQLREVLAIALRERDEAQKQTRELAEVAARNVNDARHLQRERDEAVKRLGVTVERWGATERERDEARQYAEERNDEANKLQRLLNMAAQERDEARAEVERLKADRLCQREGRASALRDVAERQREACAKAAQDDVRDDVVRAVRATPLVTEGGK